jgi:two-component system nitrogen regulation sensor histidine kinase NtrY
MNTSVVLKPGLLSVLLRKLRENWVKVFAVLVLGLSLLAGSLTYAALTDEALFVDHTARFYWLLALDGGVLTLLSGLVAWRATRVWRRRRQKLAGAQLHTQLMMSFAALTVLPAALVAVFAVLFITVGVQSWFGEQIRSAVQESDNIAQAYLQEHQQSIKADMLGMANDLNREAWRLINDRAVLEEFFKTQVYLRNLSEAVLVDGSGDIITRSGVALSLELMPDNFSDMIRRADEGDVILFVGENGDRVRAFVRLDNFIDTYLFVGRFVDEKVLSSVSATTRAVDAYKTLQSKQSTLKMSMSLVFALMCLMLLLVAMWAGLTLAEKIIDPVSRLIDAAERVRAGDLNARVVERASHTEIDTLARAFNRMTDQLGTQRRELLAANRLVDERRRFTETVLAGVNAGILGMDDKGVIQIANASAARLLGYDASALVGQRLADLCPEMETVRRVLRSKPGKSVETPIDLDRENGVQLHWIVRMTADGADNGDLRGYVATFDDLSPLIDAQRKSAWADVARRVAHEIKNPLTPIQLSAERLKKRYAKQITDDADTFRACTDTIIRHVDDIRHMVDEFSAFARMPLASKQSENLVTLCQHVMVLFQQAHRDASFVFNGPSAPVTWSVDRQQVSQALTNLVKNAYEATAEKTASDPLFKPQVTLALSENGDGVTLSVTDNGPGIAADILPRLTDPYVTTKVTGNGLGLAIVAKIVEDHGAKLEFFNNDTGGATAQIHFQKGEKKNG